jgi:hypothetical protein
MAKPVDKLAAIVGSRHNLPFLDATDDDRMDGPGRIQAQGIGFSPHSLRRFLAM